jgi:predicted DNA-binding ribbon-helix-helix protein
MIKPHYIRKRGFILHGRETSVTVEPEVLEELQQTAAREGVPLREILERIEVWRLEHGPQNRSRAVRVWVVKDLQRRLVAALEREEVLLKRSAAALETIAKNMESKL